MKKLNSFEDLGSLLSEKVKAKKQSETENFLAKQNLEVHYSIKGRAGVPVIIIKGFVSISRRDLKLFAKSIQSKLGIGGSVKNDKIILQGNKRNKIIEILKEKGFKLKLVGG